MEYYRIGLEFTYFNGNAMERLEELEIQSQITGNKKGLIRYEVNTTLVSNRGK